MKLLTKIVVMASDQTQKPDDVSEQLQKWQGHIKNVQPDAKFESEIKAEELPAQQQAARAAEITRQNQALVHDKSAGTPMQPAMPLNSANSVYPNSDHGLESSQSQTPRFNFETGQNGDAEKSESKSFLKKLFGR